MTTPETGTAASAATPTETGDAADGTAAARRPSMRNERVLWWAVFGTLTVGIVTMLGAWN